MRVIQCLAVMIALVAATPLFARPDVDPPLADAVFDPESTYQALLGDLQARYGASGVPAAADWATWGTRMNTAPVRSSAHGDLWISVYANRIAAPAYLDPERPALFPAGSVLLADAFSEDKGPGPCS